MKKKVKNILMVLLPVIFFVSGCADSVNAPDNLPPMVELYRPAKGDTVFFGKKEISYSASDDQKVVKIELWVNAKKDSTFFANPDGSNPAVYWSVDSSLINSKASVYLIAVDEAGHSAKSNESNEIFVSEDTRPPAAPKNLVVKKFSPNDVNLSWDDSSSNEKGFQVWRKEGNGVYAKIQTLPENSVSTNDYGLNPSVVYYYKVLAVNDYGANFSNEANTSGAATLPVYNLNAVAKGTSRVQLTWTDNASNELGFVIQRKVSSAYSFAEIARVMYNTIIYDDTVGLSTGGTYTYKVGAIFQSTPIVWSNEVTVTTLSQDFWPPSNLSAVLQDNGGRVYLSWKNNSTHNGTRIERKTGPNGKYEEIGRTDYNNTSYSDTQISEDSIYYYRVRGLLYSGEFTTYSNEVMVSIPVRTPAAPSNLTLTRMSSTAFNLKWDDNSSNEDHFEIWRKDGYGGDPQNYKLISTKSKNSTSTNDVVQADNLTYYYKIRAVRGNLLSEFSNVVNSTGGNGSLPRPMNVKAIPTKTSVTLNWTYPDAPSDILGFDIDRKVSWGSYNSLDMVLPSVRQYVDTENLTPSLIYVYRVRARTSTEQSDWSEEITVTIPSSSLSKKNK